MDLPGSVQISTCLDTRLHLAAAHNYNDEYAHLQAHDYPERDSQRSAIHSQRSTVSGQQSAVNSQRSTVSGQQFSD